MILMLTLVPVLWAYTTFQALITYPHNSLFKGALIIAAVFLGLAIILDYVFYGIIRGALQELYHPTTIYGYGFLAVLPFVLVWALRNTVTSKKRTVQLLDMIRALATGVICLLILILIIIFEIKL